MFKSYMTRILGWLRPAVHIGGLGELFVLWQRAGAKERGIFLLCFAPVFVCIGGLLFSVASFVLFVLPSFVLKFLGWALLVALFNMGGRYCYEHMTKGGSGASTTAGSSPFTSRFSADSTVYEATYTDVKFTEDTDEDEGHESEERNGESREGTRRTIFRKSRAKES